MPKIIPIHDIEDKSNKVTVIDDAVTDEQYPSAKAVYDALSNIEITLPSDVVGKKTTEGGEIFNDYENNQALGIYSTSNGTKTWTGSKGFYISTVANGPSEDSVLVTLSKEYDISGLSAGDIVSIQVDNNYNDIGTIFQINVADEFMPYHEIYVGSISPAHYAAKIVEWGNWHETLAEDKILRVSAKPDVGIDLDEDANKGQFVAGIENKALQKGSTSFGTLNTSLGAHSLTAGKENIAGHASAVFGSKNKILGLNSLSYGLKNNMPSGGQTSSLVGGSYNTVTAEDAVALGNSSGARYNKSVALGYGAVTGREGQVAVGIYNEEKESDSVFVVGNGVGSTRSTALRVKVDGSVEVQAQGNNNNSVVQKQYVDSVASGKISISHLNADKGINTVNNGRRENKGDVDYKISVVTPYLISSKTSSITFELLAPVTGWYRIGIFAVEDDVDFDSWTVSGGMKPINNNYQWNHQTEKVQENTPFNALFNSTNMLEDNKTYIAALVTESWATKAYVLFTTVDASLQEDTLQISAATEAEIAEGTNMYKPIVPGNIGYAVKSYLKQVPTTNDDSIYIGNLKYYEDDSNTYIIGDQYKDLNLILGSGTFHVYMHPEYDANSIYCRDPSLLGTSSNPWSAVYAKNGTIQTSSRDAKENIKLVASASTPMVMNLDDTTEMSDITSETIIDFVRNLQPVTFNYKGSDRQESKQLGLIADDIAEHDIYKYIGINRNETVEIEPAEYDEEGNVVKEAVTEEKQIFGLQALPLTTAALIACKELVNKVDTLYSIVDDLQSQIDAISTNN
jgi:hypothetical protein